MISRGRSVRHFWALLTLAAGWLAGCDFPGRPSTGDRYVPPQKEMTFAVLFKRNCAGCHGVDGNLGPAPPLNDKLFLALVPDSELRHVVSDGRLGTLMPAFAASAGGTLTPEQVNVLVEGIKPRWGSAEPAPEGAPPYLLAEALSGEAGAGNKDEGLEVFARACASCHGDRGQGGQSGGRPAGAINDPEFLALMSDQALRRFVITGRPDLGMPHYADHSGRADQFRALNLRDVKNVVALLTSWRQSVPVERKGNE